MPTNKNALIRYKFLDRAIVSVLALLLSFLPVSAAKRALLIGISDYPQMDGETWSIIHGTNDVNLLSATLKKQGYRTIVVTNKSATAANIRKQLNSFVASCKQGDVKIHNFSF